MNRTLSFTKLDYITIKPYLTLKNILIFVLVFAFIGYGTGDSSAMIGMLMMYSTIYASYPFAVGDKNGIDTLYATLPIAKKNIVAGRYIFALCLNVCVCAISLIASAILMTALGKRFSWGETLITILICFAFFSILEALQLPIYFKLGYAKAKFLAYLPLAAFPAAVMVISIFVGKDSFSAFIESMFSWIQANDFYAAAFIVIIWFLIMLFSGLLSYRFYKKRDF